MKPQVIIIVGGGFGGIKTALELDKRSVSGTKIVLISDKPHFEYHATLYRVLTGKSPLEVCIPLREIFEGTKVEVIEDKIENIDLKLKRLTSSLGFHYKYDFLVLALGAQVNYYDTEGLREFSYNISSIESVLKLKENIHLLLEKANKNKTTKKPKDTHFVIVGGGVTGCETAGELALYTKKLAKKHNITSSNIKIDLIHAGDRLVPNLPEPMSGKISERLKSLGVNITLNSQVTKESADEIFLKDKKLKSKTLIWTAGVKINDLYTNTKDLLLTEKHKVSTNLYLQAKGYKNVFVIGDAIDDKYPGMAQTALQHGKYVAYFIDCKMKGIDPEEYSPQSLVYAIPVGSGWAATKIGDSIYYGRKGWFFRKILDLRFFLSILPFQKAINAYRSETQLWESCPICNPNHLQA